MKQYEVVELIADVIRTEEGIQGTWSTAHALGVLNAKAKEGWKFCYLIPDEKGRCIMERQVDEGITDEAITIGHMKAIVELLVDIKNKKWWQFWK